MKKQNKMLNTSTSVKKLSDLPNIGPAMLQDFKMLGINKPLDLKSADPLELYNRLCEKTRAHQDPCVLDVFIAAVRFMNGDPAKPWWAYTEERKKLFLNKKNK